MKNRDIDEPHKEKLTFENVEEHMGFRIMMLRDDCIVKESRIVDGDHCLRIGIAQKRECLK